MKNIYRHKEPKLRVSIKLRLSLSKIINGKRKEKIMKTEEIKGITLIALVLTIIILIILAGVSISMLTGQNGILTKAKEAKEKTEQAQKAEQTQLSGLEEIIANNSEAVFDTVSGTNKPALTKGMIPVKWDTSKEKWVVCSKNDAEWYNYNEDKKQWANIMLCDGKYDDSTDVGTEVNEEDLGSMFVWIPRFAYKITKGYHDNSEGGMDVKFLVGKTNKTVDNEQIVEYNETTTNNYTKFPDGYVVHPAFKDGKDTEYRNGEWKSEILGIWVAKFQAGIKTTDNDTDEKVFSVNNYYYPVFKGRKFGYNYVNEEQCYDLSLALDDASNPYGLTSLANSHLMKNSEWGAVAYLSMSQYGYSGGRVLASTEKARNNLDINGTAENPNPNSSNWKIYGITGYSAPGAKTDRNAQNFVSVSKTLTNNVGNSTAWTVLNTGTDKGAGTKSSTTGNIYGVFDISCGLVEYTSAYINHLEDAKFGNDFLSGKSTFLVTAYPNESIENIDFNSAYKAEKMCSVYGDAIWETSKNVGRGNAWFENTLEDDSYASEIFFLRGGNYFDSTYSGLCGIGDTNGGRGNDRSFRSVLVIE